jgi:hypothetical protein
MWRILLNVVDFKFVVSKSEKYPYPVVILAMKKENICFRKRWSVVTRINEFTSHQNTKSVNREFRVQGG